VNFLEEWGVARGPIVYILLPFQITIQFLDPDNDPGSGIFKEFFIYYCNFYRVDSQE